MTVPFETLVLAADVQENVQTLTSGMTVQQVVALGCIVTVSVLALIGFVSWMIRTQAAADARLIEQRMQTYEKSVASLQESISKLTEMINNLNRKIVDSDALNNMIKAVVVVEVSKAIDTYNSLHSGKR